MLLQMSIQGGEDGIKHSLEGEQMTKQEINRKC
jgi:hypothetical protein